jgi:hypothetical protein
MNHLQIAKSIAAANEALINNSKPMNLETTEAGKLNALIAIAEQIKELNKSDTHKAMDSLVGLYKMERENKEEIS